MSAVKLERLMNLVATLLETRVPLSAAVIRERVSGYDPETSESSFLRQFSRDKEQLRAMGVSIRVDPVPGAGSGVVGYRIDPDEYYLPDPGLEPDELAALHLATRLIDVGAPRDEERGLFKLGGLEDPGVHTTVPLAVLHHDPNLEILFDGLTQNHELVFTYRGTPRRVVGSAMGFQGGHWYVSGWDVDADDDRLFRLDRIEGRVTLGEAISTKAGGPARIGALKPWEIGTSEHFVATMRVEASARTEVIGQLGEAAIRRTESDGSVLVEVAVTNPEGFRSWVLGWGDVVEVIAPHGARTMIVEWLEQFVEGGR